MCIGDMQSLLLLFLEISVSAFLNNDFNLFSIFVIIIKKNLKYLCKANKAR